MNKIVRSMGEKCKISIRNIRRDVLDSAKSQQKNNEISEDELKSLQDQVQKETDSFIFDLLFSERNPSIKESSVYLTTDE